MAKLVYFEDVMQSKPEMLNENIVRESIKQTARDRIYAKGWNDCNKQFIDNLGTLPSAEPEHRTGRWLIRRDTNGEPYAQCSECKKYFNSVYDMENFDAFCRHCGTKMEGLKEVEE